MTSFVPTQMSPHHAPRRSPMTAGHEGISGRIGRMLRGVLAPLQRRRMMQALERLDDRMLADIGIHRADITRIVNGYNPHAPQVTWQAQLSRTARDEHALATAARLSAY